MIINGDALEILKTFPDNEFDMLVTDPPAGISFLNEDWDHHKGGRQEWINWLATVMLEVKRVLKPGSHGLVWALPRTSHWTATALEDAGFEIRDIIHHLFGSGFPKSQDISKAIDKSKGLESKGKSKGLTHNITSNGLLDKKAEIEVFEHEPVSDEAKLFEGYGTALKPACEHWILIRKPLARKTIVENCLEFGTGAINIDGSRIETDDVRIRTNMKHEGLNISKAGDYGMRETNRIYTQGRFPANLILSHNDDCDDTCSDGCAVKELGDQSGVTKSSPHARNNSASKDKNTQHLGGLGEYVAYGHNDEGTAARFFYCAKHSPSEKNKGLETYEFERNGYQLTGNPHPTVKSISLMKYLINLLKPPKGGKLLDPFCGSGTTGIAAMQLGLDYTLIDQCEEYCKVAEMRIKAFESEIEPNLFGGN